MNFKAIYLVNSTNEDFTGRWDSQNYTIKAGKEVLLQDYLAVHLAMYLAMREISKRDPMTPINNSQDETGKFINEEFANEVRKYIRTDEEIEAESDEKLELEMLQKKRETKKVIKEEEEFPELKKSKK